MSYQFVDWIYRESKIKKQTIYNYLYKLISVAPKFLNYRVSILIKTMKFILVTLKKLKSRYLGNTTFVVYTKLLSLTFRKNKPIIKLKFFTKYKRLRACFKLYSAFIKVHLNWSNFSRLCYLFMLITKVHLNWKSPFELGKTFEMEKSI